MKFPRAIAGAIGEIDRDSLPGQFTQIVCCQGAKFHSPRPLLVDEVTLPNGETTHLCGVCRDNLRVLRELMNANGGSLPWDVRREFGNQLRSLIPMTKFEETESV